MRVSRQPDESDPVDLRLGLPLFGQRQHRVLLVKDRVQVFLVHDVLRPDLPRAELAGTNPAANRLGVAPRPSGCLWHGKHSCILQHEPASPIRASRGSGDAVVTRAARARRDGSGSPAPPRTRARRRPPPPPPPHPPSPAPPP